MVKLIHYGGALNDRIQIKLKPAGHILDSAYVEIDVSPEKGNQKKRIVFSGDLGAPYTPILSSPRSPYKAIVDNGTILIPAFSLGRTQELLYELDLPLIFSRLQRKKDLDPLSDIEIIVPSGEQVEYLFSTLKDLSIFV